MIPYVEFKVLMLGPVPIQVWGLLVGLGILAATAVAAKFAKARGLKDSVMWDLSAVSVVAAFIGARLFHVVFYEPAYFFANPIEIPQFWHGGLSMFGGLIFAAIGCVGYLW